MKKKIIVSIFLILGFIFVALWYLKIVYSVPVLMYHNVDNNAKKSCLSVTPETFEKQMLFLKEHNYQVISLDKYVDLLKSGKKPKKKSVVLTFDDGMENNYTTVYPILLRYGMPATFFVVTDWVGNHEVMNWQQIEELNKNILFSIQSHGLSHKELDKLTIGEIDTEGRESKKRLESKLKTEIKYFCYPCGSFNAVSKEILKLNGYKAACATHPGKETALNDLFAIRRIRISDSADDLFIFWAQISGYYTFFKDRRIKK